MKKLFLSILVSLLTYSVYGQMKIFVVHEKEKANVVVFKTTFFCEADLVVKKTWDHNELDEKYHWYFVDNKTYADPDWVVYYTDNIREADHVVYFTNRLKLLGSYSACEPISRQ